MTPYHPLEDLLDTYQSLSDPLQAMWLVVPPVFIAVMFALYLRYRIRRKLVENGVPPRPSYLIEDELEEALSRAQLVDHPQNYLAFERKEEDYRN